MYGIESRNKQWVGGIFVKLISTMNEQKNILDVPIDTTCAKIIVLLFPSV